MKHLGDYDASTVIYGKFTTFRPSTGAAYTLGGTPALSVYKDNSTTQSTTGVTLTVDFDSVTGLHHYAIDTSADGTFYSAGSFFSIVITTGTVDSVSVVGTVVAEFTLRKNSALKPATAGRTLVVDASGRALGDVDTIKTQTVTCAAGVTVLASVGTAATSTAQTGDAYARLGAPAGASLSADVAAVKAETATIVGQTGTTGVVVGSIAANAITATAIAAGALTATKFAAGAIDAAALAADAANEIRDAVWAKTLTEETGDPGATPTAASGVMLPYMALRNKRETDSSLGTDKLYNSAGTAILSATVADTGTVFTKAKYA